MRTACNAWVPSLLILVLAARFRARDARNHQIILSRLIGFSKFIKEIVAPEALWRPQNAGWEKVSWKPFPNWFTRRWWLVCSSCDPRKLKIPSSELKTYRSDVIEPLRSFLSIKLYEQLLAKRSAGEIIFQQAVERAHRLQMKSKYTCCQEALYCAQSESACVH